MADPGQRPLLFLDVDGPLIPFGARTRPYPTWTHRPIAPGGDANPLLARIDPAHGARLAALPCELVWATTWEADANDLVAPRIGLPKLPVVVWPGPRSTDEQDEHAGLHWKTRTLVEWAAGRPFVWVDDEPTAVDREWVAAHHPRRALLHRVDPAHGLAGRDYAEIRRWLRRTA
ncbi:HAD domain-containing protein [Streptomyces spiramenti]|uniref:Secreted protein n=1 Tax=Streptomyces spiramenti TaxID=2720606 RepID=A0ABX1AN80_9ACTN|nr:HAD domain-containing protein [Streptomyces spiramenti]NJP65927.1 hypothetical protein [Streptomyces spiramenti]